MQPWAKHVDRNAQQTAEQKCCTVELDRLSWQCV